MPDELPDTCLNRIDGHWYVITYGRAPYQIHAQDCATCEEQLSMTTVTCLHCTRVITYEDGRWVDSEAPGDDALWRAWCDARDTHATNHEPRQAGLGVGHIWTDMSCPAYRTMSPSDCTCRR
jgi:hypothetical protein